MMDNFALIVAFLSLVIILIIFIKDFIKLPSSKQIQKVKEWLLYAVILAEKQFGSGTGVVKLRFVYDLFIQKFSCLAEIISFETFSKWVDEALDKMKELLKENNSIQNILEKEEPKNEN